MIHLPALNGNAAGTLLVAAAVLVAGLAKGISGMGLPVVATPVAAAVFGLRTAVPLMVPPTVLTDVVILAVVWRGRPVTALARLGRLIPPAALGIWLGVHVLARANPTLLSVGLGLLVLAFVGTNLSGHHRVIRRPPAWCDPLVGLVCGFLQGAVGLSGPVLTMYLYQLDLDRPEFLFTSNGFFLLADAVQFFSLAQVGLENAHLAGFAALACIPALAGMSLPLAVQRHVTPRVFRTTILIMLTVAALTVLGKAVGLAV